MSVRPDPPRQTWSPHLDRYIFVLLMTLTLVTAANAAPSKPSPPTRLAAEAAPPEVMTWHPTASSKNKSQSSQTSGPGKPGSASTINSFAPAGDQQAADVEVTGHESIIGLDPSHDGYWSGPTPLHASCDDGNSAVCDPYAFSSPPTPRLWVRAEYLLWMIDGADLPPLVTASPLGTPEANIGILGGNTTILYGDDEIGQDARSGGRLTIGTWLDCNQTLGFEASYAGFENTSELFEVSSATRPNLARPYLDLGVPAEAAFLVAAEGTLGGSVSVSSERQFQFAEVLRRQCLSVTAASRTDWLVGYRFGQFDDRLRIDQTSTFLVPQGPIIAGTTLSLFDLFETDTQFHGGVFGVDHQRRSGPWTLSTLAKISLGGSRTEMTIDGGTTTTVPAGGSAVLVGGLLAQESNIGEYSESEFAVIPEFGINLTGKLNQNVRFVIGYNLMYWSGVASAADQIDRSLSQLPPEPIMGSGNPRSGLQTSGLFLHGLNTGLQFQF